MTTESLSASDASSIHDYLGLRPRAWLCFDKGYSREAIKEHLLRASDLPLTHAVLTPLDCAARIAEIDLTRTLLSRTARSEILRELVRKLGRGGQLPALGALARQRGFGEKLERAISRYRMTFAHAAEEQVMNEFLDSNRQGRPLRSELRVIAAAFSRWLEIRGLFDDARVYETAMHVLQADERGDAPQSFARLSLPQRIDCLRSRRIEARERAFFDAISKRVELREGTTLHDFGFYSGSPARARPQWTWLRFHTPDDGAEWIAQMAHPSDVTVLFSEGPEVRRSLFRALESQAIDLSDERDPTAASLDERIKLAFLSLKLVAARFRRADIRALLTAARSRRLRDLSDQRSRGGEALARRYDETRRVIESFSKSKWTLEELRKSHLEWIAEGAPFRRDHDRLFAIRYLERVYEVMAQDEHHLERERTRARLSYWYERLRKVLRSVAVPKGALAPRQGLEVYRLTQATLGEARTKLVLFGLEASLLDSRANGDYALSDSERNRLALEFQVESSEVERDFRKERLLRWIENAEEVIVVDSSLTALAKERESILPVIEELGFEAPDGSEEIRPIEMGAAPRVLSSYRPLSTLQPTEVRLTLSSIEVLNATWLDAYSRCPFYALASRRWKLYDVAEPTFELRPEVKGAILHKSVELLLKSRNADGSYGKSVGDCLDQALAEADWRGTLESEFIAKSIRKRLLDILVEFAESEREYFDKATPSTIATENLELEIECGGVRVRGKPDRIDAYQDGIVVIDYKSSGARNPTGDEILEREYGLQLPFYAIAAQERFKKKVYAQQFVVLARNGNRSRGIFPKEIVGKEPGKLIKLNSNSSSLTDLSPEEVLAKNRVAIEQHLRDLKSGRFDVVPKIEKKDCPSCTIRAVCGYNRKRVKDEADVLGDS